MGLALILRIAAPNIGMLVPLAECIIRLAGMRSEAVSRSLERRLGPARQLWQPVSAIAVVARLWYADSLRNVPAVTKSPTRAKNEWPISSALAWPTQRYRRTS